MADSAFVYVLGCPGGPCKIGWTTNISARLKRISEPAGLVEPIFCIEIAYKFGLKAERYAHWLLHQRHYRNEWFNVDPDMAIEAVRTAVALDFDKIGKIPPLPNWRNMPRFPEGTFDRIEAVLESGEDRTDFVRDAVERELKRRERHMR